MSVDDDQPDPHAFAEAVEAVLLGGPRTLSPRDLAEQAGVEVEFGRRLWRSMGFAMTEDDEIALTAQDLAATQRVKHAIDLGIIGIDDVASLTRLTGQVFAQLAEGEGDTIFRMALARNPGGAPREVAEQIAAEVLPLVEDVHSYVWRRQLAAYVARTVAQTQEAAAAGVAEATATVGFADISGYTALSRHTTETDLAALLERFESVATDAVGAHDGRVVKLIGDAVLYTAPGAAAGVRIALDLLAAWGSEQPAVRAGIATGAVLRRLGDVFGPTVNIASRLTSLGEPGEVRVDAVTSTALSSVAAFRLVEQPPTDVRGYERLRSWTVTEDSPA